MKKFLLVCVTCIIALSVIAQEKGTCDFLEKCPGIYPVMLNDSITKHMKVLTPIGSIEKGNALCALDEDYCVLNTANLIEVKVKFSNYLATNVMFFVAGTFKSDCLAELTKLYGEPEQDGNKYTWMSKGVLLVYDTKPSKSPEKAVGIFFRRQDIGK